MSKVQVSSGMETLPTIVRGNEVGIPTKSLNTVQQKNYREYADKVCATIKNMLGQIKVTILNNLRGSNLEKVRRDILANTPEIKEIVKELTELNKKAEVATGKALKIMTDYEFAKSKLTAEMETKIASLKSDEMMPLIEAFGKLKEKSRKQIKNEAYSDMLYSAQAKIATNRQYSYDDEDDSNNNVYTGKVVKNLEVAYPSLVIPMHSETSFINPDAVENKLKELMKPAIAEFEIAEVKLEAMEQNVKEIMMFDERLMNEAFQKLFAFRDSIQQKHLEVVRKINYNLNEE